MGSWGGRGSGGGGRGHGCQNSSSQVLHSSLGAGHIPCGAARPGVGAGAPLKPPAPKEHFPDTHRLPLSSLGSHWCPAAEVRLGQWGAHSWRRMRHGRALANDPEGVWLRINGPPQPLAPGGIFAMNAFPWIKCQEPLQGVVFATCPTPFEPPRCVPRCPRRILAALGLGESHRSLFPVSPEGTGGMRCPWGHQARLVVHGVG